CSADLAMQHRRFFVLDRVLAEDWSGFAFVDAASASETDQPRLYLGELAGGEDVVILWRKCLKLGFGAANAIVVHGMSGECAGDETVLLFFPSINPLEEIDECRGVVSSCIFVLHTQEVSFALSVAAEFQE